MLRRNAPSPIYPDRAHSAERGDPYGEDHDLSRRPTTHRAPYPPQRGNHTLSGSHRRRVRETSVHCWRPALSSTLPHHQEGEELPFLYGSSALLIAHGPG